MEDNLYRVLVSWFNGKWKIGNRGIVTNGGQSNEKKKEKVHSRRKSKYLERASGQWGTDIRSV